MYSNRSTITPLGPSHLAWENVSKGTEGVVQCLIVDGFVQVLDENVSDTWATERGVTLRPHNSHWTSLDGVEVHGIQSSFSWCGGVGRGKEEEREKWTQKGKEWKKGRGEFPVKTHLTLVSLTVCWLLEVDIGVAKTPPGHDVSAHSDGENRSRRAEPLEQHGLANLGVEVSHVQRGDRIAGRVCHRHSQVFGSEFESPRETSTVNFNPFFRKSFSSFKLFFWYFLAFLNTRA